MKRIRWAIGILALIIVGLVSSPVNAAPFGQGLFGADVPFGSATSISINLGSDVALNLSPSGGNFSGTGSHTVTVTSTDVVGYYLYAHTTGTTNMVNNSGGATIPASNNASLSPLSVGSWGYNTSGSTSNFLGMKATSVLLKDASGPYKSGDPTTITYGALTNNTQAAGNYSVAVTYTAVAKNQ